MADTERVDYCISLEEEIQPESQTECVYETPFNTQTEKSLALEET